MKKETIVQFICFDTTLAFDEFVLQWDQYAKGFKNPHIEVTLQQQTSTRNKFQYISKHKWPLDDFQFTFMKGRHSEYFPERQVKVLQAGGYMPIQVECKHDDDQQVKILVFLANLDTDISHYKELQSYRYLNIYQAYYESCVYDYILEFFVDEENATEFMTQLKTKTGSVEAGMYKECLVLAK